MQNPAKGDPASAHRPRSRRSLALAITLPLLLLVPSAALAAEPTAAEKETARSLLLDGRAKMAAKDFEGALKALRAAHEIMHVPTTGLDYAAALEATGRLVEARVVALEVTRIPPKDREPEAFVEARANAGQIAERLAARIPAVVVTVKGLAAGVEPAMTIDGDAIPSAAIGLPNKANPGTRTIVVSAQGYFPIEKKVQLAEGQTVPLEVTLKPAPVTAAPGPVGAPGTLPDDADKNSGKVPVWAWVSGGVGLVALGVSAGFAADYVAVKNLVSTDCPNNTCGSKIYASDHLPDQLGRWNRDLGVFIGAGAVGVVAVTVGIVGIARARGAKKAATTGQVQKPHVDFAPWLVPGAAGGTLAGAF